MVARIAERRQRRRQHDGEDDQGQKLSIRRRLHEVRLNQRMENVGRRRALEGVRLIDGGTERHADAGVDHIDQDESDKDRDSGRRQEIEDRDAAEPSELADIAEGGHAGNHRREDQRHDQHLEGIEKQGAEPAESGHGRAEIPPGEDAENDAGYDPIQYVQGVLVWQSSPLGSRLTVLIRSRGL